MNTSWADKTADSLRGAKEANAREQEQFMQNYRLILAQFTSLWNDLRSIIQANVSKLRDCEPYLQFADEGGSAFRVTSWKGRDQMVVKLDGVARIQYEIYRRERPRPEEPNVRRTLTFEVEREQVCLTTTEGVNMKSTTAAECLLDALVSI